MVSAVEFCPTCKLPAEEYVRQVQEGAEQFDQCRGCGTAWRVPAKLFPGWLLVYVYYPRRNYAAEMRRG